MSDRHEWRRRAIWVAAGIVLAGLVFAIVYWGRPLYELVADQARVAATVKKLGPWAPVAIMLLQVLQVLLAPLPGQAIQAASGYLYGLWLGTLYAMIGLVAGSLLDFALVRRFGRPLVRRLAGADALERVDNLARRGGALFFFLIWLLPFTPDDLACMAAGLTPMSFRQFLVLVTIGRLPGVFVSVWVGANAARISPTLWIVALVLLALFALVAWRWGNRIVAAALAWLEKLTGRQGEEEPYPEESNDEPEKPSTS